LILPGTFTTPTGGGGAGGTVAGLPTAYSDRIHSPNGHYEKELLDNAPLGRKDSAGGSTSYEVSGFFCGQSPYSLANDSNANVRKTEKTVINHIYQTFYARYNYVGQTASYSDVMIIYDGDDVGSGDPNRQTEDFPDPGDNHGADGANMVFCDGHAQWVRANVYASFYIKATDEPNYQAAGTK
jgi:prepilin-type processing-associated H-X9-DG protein